MHSLRRNSSLVIATALFLIAGVAAADAAGAFAVGACGAYGYSFDFRKVAPARAAAMKKCSGRGCRIVGIMRRACAALSVDAGNPCGAYGWAIESHLGKAENAATHRCYQYGGHTCVVRAWACDEKG